MIWQGECQWLHVDFIKEVMERAREIFPTVQYAYSTVPSYPSGQLGFIVAAKEAAVDLSGVLLINMSIDLNMISCTWF